MTIFTILSEKTRNIKTGGKMKIKTDKTESVSKKIKFVNLDNVASVWYDGNKKVVFNLATSIKIMEIVTTDYIKKVFESKEEAEEYLVSLTKYGFFSSGNIKDELINVGKVNTIVIDKNKVIFNFNYSTEIIVDGVSKIVGRYVTWEGNKIIAKIKNLENFPTVEKIFLKM